MRTLLPILILLILLIFGYVFYDKIFQQNKPDVEKAIDRQIDSLQNHIKQRDEQMVSLQKQHDEDSAKLSTIESHVDSFDNVMESINKKYSKQKKEIGDLPFVGRLGYFKKWIEPDSISIFPKMSVLLQDTVVLITILHMDKLNEMKIDYDMKNVSIDSMRKIISECKSSFGISKHQDSISRKQIDLLTETKNDQNTIINNQKTLILDYGNQISKEKTKNKFNRVAEVVLVGCIGFLLIRK